MIHLLHAHFLASWLSGLALLALAIAVLHYELREGGR